MGKVKEMLFENARQYAEQNPFFGMSRQTTLDKVIKNRKRLMDEYMKEAMDGKVLGK